MEIFSLLINSQVLSKKWTPVQVRKVKVSHLLFADDVLLFSRTDRDSIYAVKQVLDVFLQSSRLSVNNSKSSIWFAPSTPEGEKRLVRKSFSFKVETKPGTYLGHSLGIGNKTSDFKPIIDKLVGKMDLWNSKFLSKAGRVTLLNSVCSPLLAYYMQNLKLPVSVCNSIEKIQRNFFWKSGNKQSIHTINWETICKPKWLGGLGIGRVKERNHALLAKLSWRVSIENQQVWAKLMKIYNQASKANGSVVGKGIKWGLSLLELGLHSVIHSGKDTFVWKDTWAGSTPIRHLICGPLNLHEDNLPVNNFADDLGKWNWDKISFDLPLHIKEKIMGIPCFKDSDVKDKKAWSLSASGVFDLKSAYCLAICNSLGIAIPSSNLFAWIWKLVCPKKIKVFVWLCFNNAIPCREILSARGFHIPNVCPICNQVNESQIHILRDCPFARRMWGNLNFKALNCHSDYRSWIYSNATDHSDFCHNLSRSTVFVYGLWELWLNRNNYVFNGAHSMPASCGRNTYVKSVEFSHLAKDVSPRPSKGHIWVKWTAPSEGWWNNTDGACAGNPGKMAAAGVIRDCNGNWIQGFSKCLGFGNSLKAEIWAIVLGVSMAKDLACEKLIIESDSLVAIKLLTVDFDYKSHVLGALIHFCRSIVQDFTEFQINHVFREGNCCADVLAKQAILDQGALTVFHTVPSFLLFLVFPALLLVFPALFHFQYCFASGGYVVAWILLMF
ncbi:reverse transcriptase [Senna tora]|uniref:Reverse transcriptase n=1 Tax=Senna tora TaxID=362788 RepID=A0A834WJV2_9FABA|nr:reverse transcriptase [Senna tora]